MPDLILLHDSLQLFKLALEIRTDVRYVPVRAGALVGIDAHDERHRWFERY